MFEAIQAGYGALKGGLDIAGGFQSLKTEAAVNQAVIEIQRAMLGAQQALNEAEMRHAADQKIIAKLENELAQKENWETEKQKYELKAIDRGAFAYMRKEGVEGTEPLMWLCQQCFDIGHKSALTYKKQAEGRGGHGTQAIWGCNRCRAEVSVYFQRVPAEPYDPA